MITKVNKATGYFLVAAAAVLFSIGSLSLKQQYETFVARVDSEFDEASRRASIAVEDFRNRASAINVVAFNTTGGTMHVYVGQLGATRDVASGVSVPAQPTEVLSVAPHGSSNFSARDWKSKYLIATTTYLFLSSVQSRPIKFSDASFSGDPTTFSVTIYALSNPADSNYTYHDEPITPFTAQDVENEQSKRIDVFESSQRVSRNQYSKDFLTFLQTLHQ